MADATFSDYSPDIGTNTTYYVLVPRTDDEGDTLAEYFRLGAPSEVAEWDATTLMEAHAVGRYNPDKVFSDLPNDYHPGEAGTLD